MNSKKEGISVTCLMPGPTKTNFSLNNKLPIPNSLLYFYMAPDQVALKGLLALAKNQTLVITGGISKTITFISKFIPPSLLYKIQKKFWVNKRDSYFWGIGFPNFPSRTLRKASRAFTLFSSFVSNIALSANSLYVLITSAW